MAGCAHTKSSFRRSSGNGIVVEISLASFAKTFCWFWGGRFHTNSRKPTSMSSPLRQQHFKLLADDLISAKIRSVPALLREPLLRLIRLVRSYSSLLSHRQRTSSTDSNSMEQLLVALTRMAERAENWVRPPEDWIVPNANPAVQFRALVNHLFDTYPVPRFMARVWLSPYDKPWEIEMYLHLAAGRSIRQFSLPFSLAMPLTKNGAAWLMQAPDDLVPIAAMRWAHGHRQELHRYSYWSMTRFGSSRSYSTLKACA